MKKTALLIFVLLTLGCGTEKPIVEEPEPVIEKLAPAVVKGEPVIPEIASLRIIDGTVKHGDVNVDPEPLNRSGFIFDFPDQLRMYTAEIQDNHGAPLSWSPLDVVDRPDWIHPNRVKITPIPASQLLEYDTEYAIKIYAQVRGCNGAETVMHFRTKRR